MRRNVMNSYKDLINFITKNNLEITIEEVVSCYSDYARGFYCKPDVRLVISKNEAKVKLIANHKGVM